MIRNELSTANLIGVAPIPGRELKIGYAWKSREIGNVNHQAVEAAGMVRDVGKGCRLQWEQGFFRRIDGARRCDGIGTEIVDEQCTGCRLIAGRSVRLKA